MCEYVRPMQLSVYRFVFLLLGVIKRHCPMSHCNGQTGTRCTRVRNVARGKNKLYPLRCDLHGDFTRPKPERNLNLNQTE